MLQLKSLLKRSYSIVRIYRAIRNAAILIGFPNRAWYRKQDYFSKKAKLTPNSSSLLPEQLIVLGQYKNKRYKILASPGNLIETYIYAHGAWELRILDFIYDYLHGPSDTDMVMLDIGANVGATTIPLAKCFPNTTFIAIEANPQIADRLNKNCQLNLLKNVTIINKIATTNENPPEMTFYAQALNDSNTGLSSVRKNYDLKNYEPTKVTTITVDQLTETLNCSVKIIKIDVQGEELNVLRSSIHTIKRFKPVIIFEFEEEYLSTYEKDHSKNNISGFFEELGYTIYGFIDDASIAKIKFGTYFHGDIIAIPN